MSYDGFYGELSTRGTVSELLNQANSIKDSILASEAAVAADTSEVGWKHEEVTLKAAQAQANANLVSTKAQEVTLEAAQVQATATLVATKAQEVQDNSDYVAGIAAHYPPDVIGTADPRLTDAREWTAATVTKAEAEAGIETTRRAFTAQRVRQAIVAWAPATATRWPTWEEVSNKPGTFTATAHTHTWAQVTGIPATATRWPTAAEAGAAPASHTHPYLPLAGGTLTGSLSVTGNITATGNVTAYSDIKLKENIEVIPDALTKINTLHGYTYNLKDIKDDSRHTGVIAQEVQKVLPEAVLEDEDGTLSVAYGNMVGLLIEAIKELKAEVDELKGVK